MESVVGNLLVGDTKLSLVGHFGILLSIVHGNIERLESLVVLTHIAIELSCIDVVIAALSQKVFTILYLIFVTSLAFRNLGILDFALQSVCHVLQIRVEESRIEGFLVNCMMQHKVMGLESRFRINLVCFAELACIDATTLEGLADESLSLLALSHDFLFRSRLLVYLGSNGFVYLLSLCHLCLSFLLKSFEGSLINLSHDGADTQEQRHRNQNLFHVL